MKSQIKTVGFFFRQGNVRAEFWEKKIKFWLSNNFPGVKVISKKPQALIVLGGDGTILEATRKFKNQNPIFIGLNLGQVGFLASARKPEKFISDLKQFFSGHFKVVKRMTIKAEVLRNNKAVFVSDALNEIVVQNPLSMVQLEVKVEGDSIQKISGSGILVATANGSTAYNLSAHGPIIMPNIKCIVITELMDHDIPTPSIVIKRDRKIEVKVISFRRRGLLSVSKTGKPVDVLLISDGETLFSLERGDVVKVVRSPRLVKFAELEKNYFFKSLQEKFRFT